MAGASPVSWDDISLETDYCQGYSSDEESEMGFSEFWLTSPIYPHARQMTLNSVRVCLIP